MRDRIIINLASKEYAQGIEKYITPRDRFLIVEFGELTGGKVKQKEKEKINFGKADS